MVEVNGRNQAQTLGDVAIGAASTAIQRDVYGVLQNVNGGSLTATLTPTPLTVSGLQLWYAQEFIENVNKVSQWTDMSGNNRHATQTVLERQPESDAWDMNGHRGLEFNEGEQRFMYHPYLGEIGTVFIVAYPVYTSTHRSFMGADSNVANTGSYYLKNTATNGLVDFSMGNAANGGTSTYATHPGDRILSIFTYEYDTSNNYMRVHASASNAEGFTTFEGTRAPVVNTNGNPVIGAAYWMHGVVDHLTGFVYEILFYNPRLSSADYTKVYDYLKQKYALT